MYLLHIRTSKQPFRKGQGGERPCRCFRSSTSGHLLCALSFIPKVFSSPSARKTQRVKIPIATRPHYPDDASMKSLFLYIHKISLYASSSLFGSISKSAKFYAAAKIMFWISGFRGAKARVLLAHSAVKTPAPFLFGASRAAWISKRQSAIF